MEGPGSQISTRMLWLNLTFRNPNCHLKRIASNTFRTPKTSLNPSTMHLVQLLECHFAFGAQCKILS